MIDTVHLINNILPLFYLITFASYLIDFVLGKKFLTNSKRIFLFLTLLLHAIYLIVRTIEFNHPPITTKFEIFSVLAFALIFSYFILELLTDIRWTGYYVIFFRAYFSDYFLNLHSGSL